ncbi:MAG: amidohydrolase [Dehalococcoidia bacterium]|nr:amidohydrolase [Dehalococcoidia bacterium]
MIIDVHTHVFPPRMLRERARLAQADRAFGALYDHPRARMATADDLLASMDRAGVDVSVAAGFWWHDGALAAEHAAYLLEAAAASGGRLLPFVPVDLASAGAAERLRALAAAGARGVGEVRPANQALAPAQAARCLVEASAELGLALLLHGSEEVGHEYAGKAGGFTPGDLWALLQALEERGAGGRAIAAHWGGGLPFYALMPEVRAALAGGRLAFDTAGTPLLYDPSVFVRGLELVDERLVLWGSDFPLRDQAADRAAAEAALPDGARRAAVLGENAARFLGL